MASRIEREKRRRVLAKSFSAMALFMGALFMSPPALAAQTPAVIKLWDYHIHDKKFRQNTFKDFNKANPDIKVEYTSQVSGTYETILDAAFRTATPPDIFSKPGSVSIGKMVEMGWIMPLDDLAPSGSDLQKWMATFPQEQTPFLAEYNMSGGKVYSWPIQSLGGAYMFFWNTKLFRESGVPQPPETIQDVRTAAKKITELGQGKVYGIVHGVKNPVIWEQDVFFPAVYLGWPWIDRGLDMRTGYYDYHNPGLRQYIQLWLDMKQDGTVFPGDLSMDDEQAKFKFSQDLAGMIFGGPWVPGGLLAVNEALEFDTSLPPTEKKGVRTGSFGTGNGGLAASSEYFVSKKTRSPNAVWRVIQFMTSSQYQEGWVKAGGGYSAFPQYNKPEYFPHPTIAKIAQMGVTGRRTMPTLPPPSLPAGAWDKLFTYAAADTLRRPSYLETMEGMWIGKLGWDAWADLERRNNAALDNAFAQLAKEGIKLTRADITVPDWDPAENYPPPKSGKK